jgi:solute:Na+ symporter, SSS family
LAPADGIKVTGARPEISGRPVGSLLYTLLQNAVRAVLAALVLCGIVAASFSYRRRGDSRYRRRLRAQRAQYKGGVRLGVAGQTLFVPRIVTVPIALVGLFFAVRVPEAGILLTLAFDVLFAGLLVPFVLGLYWRVANGGAALAAIVAGTTTRLLLFALVPAVYAAENIFL